MAFALNPAGFANLDAFSRLKLETERDFYCFNSSSSMTLTSWATLPTPILSITAAR